ncbi:lipopolysaccharide biosynthesis protein [Streptomyces sp. NPDC006739]|uniref:lipopolysaccharide biosynthesis protein n=1 Tax=Streptomyces sp. NPDC006739 TaxID=3364763 RepID=UPI00369F08CF
MTDKPSPPAPPAHRMRARAALLLRWLVPAGALLGAAAGGAYGVLKPAQYTATSYVLAVPADRTRADSATALGYAQAYGRVVTQLAVLGDAQKSAGVPLTKLRESVQVATSPDAPMIAITATSGRPGRAAAIADAVSGALTAQADRSRNDTGVALVRLSRALRPLEPSSASPALTSLVGASAGGLLGGLALLSRPRRATRDGESARPQLPGPAIAADEPQEAAL